MAESGETRETRWLTPDELETWMALNFLIAVLPDALGRQLQRDSELSFIEYHVLVALSEQPDRTMRIGRLAALANAEQSRLSHLIGRLEKRGLVRREPDSVDRRVTNAILTDAGLDALTAAAPGHVNYVRELIFDVLDTDAQHALRAGLHRILAGFDHLDLPDGVQQSENPLPSP